MTLKTRIIPVVLCRGQQAVKGEGFGWQRPIGQLAMTVRVYSGRMVDELVLFSVSGDCLRPALVSSFADACLAPLCVGGGIRSLDQVTSLLAAGADSVALNTGAVERPTLVSDVARRIGSQSCTVSIDVRKNTVHVDSGATDTGLDPVQWARDVERLGAGQIIINRCERDGTLRGYDLELLASIASAVAIPVVALGGAGNYEHFVEAIDAGAHAVAAGAMFSFTDATPHAAARHLIERGVPARVG